MMLSKARGSKVWWNNVGRWHVDFYELIWNELVHPYVAFAFLDLRMENVCCKILMKNILAYITVINFINEMKEQEIALQMPIIHPA